MNIVYYAIIYFKDIENINTEIHLKPFETKEQAIKCCEDVKEKYNERVIHTKIRRTDLSKTGEFWL